MRALKLLDRKNKIVHVVFLLVIFNVTPICFLNSNVVECNNTHHLFTSYTFEEADLFGDVALDDFEKAWSEYQFDAPPLELISKQSNGNVEKKIHARNCREIDNYTENGWYPDNTLNINLADSYWCACFALKLLSDTEPLKKEREKKHLRVIPNHNKIVFRTLPYYLIPHMTYFSDKYSNDVSLGELIENNAVECERTSENTLKITFGEHKILVKEIASARFLDSKSIKTLVNITLHDKGSLSFGFPQLVSRDPETGLMYCEDFE